VWFVFVHDREVERTLRQVWHCVCILPSQYRMQRQVRLLIDCCDRAHGCATAESLGLLKVDKSWALRARLDALRACALLRASLDMVHTVLVSNFAGPVGWW
jgi:hypothetical protein